ncbi:hypothetical protein K7862_00880 [Streptomyces sp. PLK6-54]|uniref:Integral membrane protein n=1 Tax=Actinacidiphila acidipaludis TaxID=2873382 RepID=A0ABS7Q173_9ACTN|nr:hypothetical protein [Streptomyces acidipaludis]
MSPLSSLFRAGAVPSSGPRPDTSADAHGPKEAAGGRRWDVAAAGAALLLFAAMAALGAWLQRDSPVLRSPFPPLEAWWRPHAGPGTPLAVTVAVLVVAYGPALAERLPWRALLGVSWAAAMAWTWSLALVDGWHRGIAGRLRETGEYLTQLHRFDDLGPALRTYTDHILIDSPRHWTTHIAGHPAGAVLTFVGLDRIGLGGGVWAAAFVMTTGTSLVVAALVTLRLLTGERGARAAAPFLVLAPGAVWVGVSADGYFAAVAAWSLALLAVAATRTSTVARAAAGFGGGLLFGAACYLSYGLVLLAVPAAVVLLCARTARPVPYALAGAAVVVAAFTAAGFDWWQAYGLLRIRYYQGYGGVRPYGYWFFGDIAAVAAAAGLASAAGLRRVAAALPGRVRTRLRGDRAATAAVLLPVGFVLAMLVADLTGMSKAETERIWLPFSLWLPAGAAFLPRRDDRAWLAAQALAALLLNHLLLTGW